MICWKNTHIIAKFVLLGLLCFVSVFSATIERTQGEENDGEKGIAYEDEVNDSKDVKILHFDFFRFTTRKRYIWEDWDRPEPTRDYGNYGGSSSSKYFVLYVIIPICAALIVGTLVYYCIKHLGGNNCYSTTESDSYSSITADRFTTVHRPPQRREATPAQFHGPLTWRTQNAGGNGDAGGINTFLNTANANPTQGVPRREPAVRNIIGGLYSNDGTTHATGVMNYFSNVQGRRQPDNAVSENPPDYSTVTLNDLVNPDRPAFPNVRKEDETPPPEYGKQNPFL